jgi:type IV pilus assembly protein PilC
MPKSAVSKTNTIMFQWEGKNSAGAKQKGFISSPNADLVKAKLRRQGIVPTKVRKKPREFGGKQKIEAGDIAIFASS